MDSLEERIKTLESSVSKISERNRKVEKDKAWETSLTRIISIASLTYLVIYTFMAAIGTEDPLRNALIPTTGYLLSTLSFSFIKKFWLRTA